MKQSKKNKQPTNVNIAAADERASAADTDAAEKKTKWFRRPLVRKLGYLFISLLIATTLWGYVLMSENPDRMKHVSDVPLKFEGGSEADLRSRGFVVLGESQNLLPDVTVTVKTKLNDLPSFGNSAGGEIVSASVSLQGINAPGEYECDVIASTTIGTVYSVEPRTVKITVDELVTRTIPITCAVTGDLPAGYWNGDVQLAATSIDITGPRSSISNIVRANCVLNLDGRTESVNEAFELTLIDSSGQIAAASSIVGTLPSVIVRMDIKPQYDIVLQTLIETTGRDDNYEASYTVKPSVLSIVASQDVIDKIKLALESVDRTTIYVDPIDISDMQPGETRLFERSVLGLPSNIQLLTENNFTVSVQLEEATISRTFSDIELSRIVGEDHTRFIYNYDSRSCSVIISGKSGFVNSLSAEDLLLTLNVSGCSEGTHTLVPTLELADHSDLLSDAKIQCDVGTIICVISKVPDA